jgi:YidC/Oxa1 family membrane protein insertase
MVEMSLNPWTALKESLRWIIDRLHEQGHFTYGWSIVVLTIIVRLTLVPLAVKQLRSMRHMQEASPQIKELQKKYAGDKQRQQQELMNFYKEHEINPFASCLPILFQAPIFLALFYVLRDFSKQVSKDADLSFLGIVPNIGADVKSIGWGAVVLLVVYGMSQLLSFEVSATPATPQFQRWLMRVAPIAITLGVLIYPNITAGLLIYWVTTNLWTCGQQLILKHKIGPALIPATVGPLASSVPSGPAPKGWRARLEAMQAQIEGPKAEGDADVVAPTTNAKPARAATDRPARDDDQDKRRPRPKGGTSQGGSPPPRRRPPKKGKPS